MFSRILLGAVSVAAGGILASAVAAAGSEGDPSTTAAASAPLPELTVAPPTDYPDVRLLNGYAFSGQAAFNPANPKRLVVGIVFGTACYVKASADGGKTWGALVQLPQLANTECSFELPAVTYAAGGGRLYAAYIYTRLDSDCLNGVAVSVSTDQGATWSTPTSVFGEAYTCGGVSAGPEGSFASGEGFNDVRVAAAPDGPWVYVAAQQFQYHDLVILLGSSGDQGLSWTGKEVAHIFSDGPQFFRGFALAAGRKGNVMVANGYEDGSPSYRVYVIRSSDHGASVDYSIADQSDSFLLSDPDIKIGPLGTAHLVYAKGDNPGRAILYKFSLPPYNTWSAEPVRLDDSAPQSNLDAPHLAVGACGQASVLHATWSELGKILYTRKVARPGYAWSEPLKVGTLKNGIYTNGLAAAGPKAFSVFSGRTSPEPQNKWGIAGSRVSSGVTCP